MVALVDRFLFLFPMVVGGWMLLAFVVCTLFFYIGWNLGSTPAAALAAAFFAMPLVPWFAFRGYQIAYSMHRFSSGGRRKAA